MKTAEEIIDERLPLYDGKLKDELIAIIQEYASQFRPTPSSTVDLESDAEELYPYVINPYINSEKDFDDLHYHNEQQQSLRKAYIKGRQTTSQKGLEELIKWLKLEAADLMDSNNATDKAASIYIKNCVITKATELLNKP